MKTRVVAIIDIERDSFTELAAVENKIREGLADVASFVNADWFDMDMKERRGNSKPDIKKMKFRQN